MNSPGRHNAQHEARHPSRTQTEGSIPIMIVFDVPLWMVLSILATTVLPVVVGLVTTRATDPAIKAVLLAALSVAAQLLIELSAALEQAQPYNLGLALLLGAATFMGSVAIHYGLYKPTRTADKLADTLITSDGRHEA